MEIILLGLDGSKQTLMLENDHPIGLILLECQRQFKLDVKGCNFIFQNKNLVEFGLSLPISSLSDSPLRGNKVNPIKIFWTRRLGCNKAAVAPFAIRYLENLAQIISDGIFNQENDKYLKNFREKLEEKRIIADTTREKLN